MPSEDIAAATASASAATADSPLSLMHPKQKLMWIAYWATAVPFFEKHIGHAFNLSSEALHGFLPGVEGLGSERQRTEWLEQTGPH